MQLPKSTLVLLISTGLAIAFGYSNCQKVDVAADTESLRVKLSSVGGILINDDAPFTISQDVQLSLLHDGADQMYITDVSGCTGGGEWTPFSPSKPWNLKASNSEGKVFVKYRDKYNPEIESTCFEDSILHDNQAPQIRITRNVASVINTADARIEFAVDDTGSGVDKSQCSSSINPSNAACSNSHTVSGLSEGNHSIRIESTDRAGNVATPVVANFMVDRTPPVVTLNQVPPKVTSDLTADFQFSAVDLMTDIDKLECRLDTQASFSACSSPFSVSAAEGVRTFYVRAFDRAGNVSSPVSYDWTILSLAPSVQITKFPPAHANSTSAIFEFDGSAGLTPLTQFECSVDGGVYTACTSPKGLSALTAGSHAFAVRGVDSSGTRSSPAMYYWNVDLTAPTVTITSRPSAITNQLNATIAFQSSDSGSGVDRNECQVDNGAYASCSSPVTLNALSEGSHRVLVRAVDNAGNVSQPATANWIIDTTKPIVEILSGPAGATTSKNAQFDFRAYDPGTTDPTRIARMECQIDSGLFLPCSSPSVYPMLDGQHNFAVRAVDAAGNISDVVSHQWQVDSAAPVIHVSKQPLSVIPTTETAEFIFSVTDAGSGVSSVQCGLNNQLQACLEADQKSFTSLAWGNYVFSIVATDKLGQTSRRDVAFKVERVAIPYSQNIAVSSNSKVDILVVIDNSGSMATEQKNMASRFGTFLDQLKNLDWQVAIITTDVSSDANLKDGRFVQFNGLTTATYILNSSMDLTTAKNAFAATIQRTESGSGNEQGIRASYRAVERSVNNTLAVNAPNRSFFRSGAALSVLVVTDADETPTLSNSVTNTADGLISLVKTTWGNQKPFSFQSIIVKPNDEACLKLSGAANEGYGLTYNSLSEKTGGIVGSVCATDYSSQLTAMGKAVTELVQSATLQCQPLDITGDGVVDVRITTATGATAPAYTVVGNKITFASPLPVGTNTLDYSCLQP